MPDGTTRLRQNNTPVHSYLRLGTFGRFTIVQESAAIAVPFDAPLDLASIVGCAVATGIGSVLNTARVEPGSAIAVFGCGGVGLAIVQGAHLAHAAPIIAIDLGPEKLALARRLGATHTLRGDEPGLTQRLRKITGGRGLDYAFEAIGLAGTTETAIRSLGKGGTAVLVGQSAGGVSVAIDPLTISDEEQSIMGSNYGSCRPLIDFPRILDLHADGSIDLEPMVTRRIQLEDINTGFDDMRAHSGARTIIEYQGRHADPAMNS